MRGLPSLLGLRLVDRDREAVVDRRTRPDLLDGGEDLGERFVLVLRELRLKLGGSRR